MVKDVTDGRRQQIAGSKRWVVKIGSALLTHHDRGLNTQGIADWVQQVVELLRSQKEVVLVSSGSVAEGMHRLSKSARPEKLHELQACAAVGQMGLIQAYESEFMRYGVHTAQILLTHDDLADRSRYLNLRRVLRNLIELGVVPIINENNSVTTDEIHLGDNDTLAASVANLWDADLLVILTDTKGLYSSDPRLDASATLVSVANVEDAGLDSMVGGSLSGLGLGGMVTKLEAARKAARSGAWTWLMSGFQERSLLQLAAGGEVGTLLYTDQTVWAAKKRWLASHLQMKGVLTLDEGAVKALRQGGVSLLAVGVVAAEGEFARGDMVSCHDRSGNRVACGLVNYPLGDVLQLLGKSTHQIQEVLGYANEDELIHCDNMVLEDA